MADSRSVADDSSSDFGWKIPQIPIGSWLLLSLNKYQSKQLFPGMGEERTSSILCLKIQAVDVWGKSTSKEQSSKFPNILSCKWPTWKDVVQKEENYG